MSISGTSGLVFPDATTMVTGVQAVKAWVNFNGTGTVAIRASYNVASITDRGTGEFTVNFTTAMPDANYCAVFGTQASGTGGIVLVVDQTTAPTTTALAIECGDTAAFKDMAYNYVAIFR